MQIPYRKPGKFSQIPSDPLMTAGRVHELEGKLIHLKEVSRPQAAAEVERLAQLGDFSENAEYQLAKGRLRGINASIVRIELELKRAEVIPETGESDTVRVGSTVEVEVRGEVKTFTILGSTEARPTRGVISRNSPVGAALLGACVGEEVFVQLPTGPIGYKILAIR